MRQHAQRLVELLGGTDTVRTAVDRLYQRLLTDPDLLTYFEDVDVATLRAHMTASLVLVLDVPEDTTGFTTEAIRLQDAHAHLDITDDAFDQTAGHLLDVLAELEVDPDLVDDAIIKIAALRPHIVRAGSSRLSEIQPGPARPSPSGDTLVGPRLLLEPLRIDHAEEMAARPGRSGAVRLHRRGPGVGLGAPGTLRPPGGRGRTGQRRGLAQLGGASPRQRSGGRHGAGHHQLRRRPESRGCGLGDRHHLARVRLRP